MNMKKYGWLFHIFLVLLLMCSVIASAKDQQNESVDSSSSQESNDSPFYKKAFRPFANALREDILGELPFQLHGFVEARGGMRLRDDDQVSRSASLGELRLQLDAEKWFDWGTLKLKSDFYYDAVGEDAQTDLREANVLLYPFTFMDVKVGRQILTWGTGDLIFINDLFPKDWQSFFTGRDVEYLKAPSDAIKASMFFDLFNIDLVYVPVFDPDRYITGEKISYWSDALGRRAGGEDDNLHVDKPDDWFDDDEIHIRIYKNISGYEAALYFYDGFWKSPAGMDPQSGDATFPPLSVYGASLRGTVFKGIGNAEIGYYDSKDDRDGDDPFVRNSELRFLVGYEQELARNLTGAVQYYLEYMMDYENYRETLPPGSHHKDEDRHVITVRLTQLMMNQNLELSLFTFWSPSDQDAYFRPKVNYKFTDRLEGEVGANIFAGEHDYTFFGQFEHNSNVYAGIRYSF